MPTGYTGKIYNGEEQAFEEFILRCARGVAAFIGQRDDSPEAPLKRAEPNNYYGKKMDEVSAELNRLKAMSPQEATAAESEERGRAMDERQKCETEAPVLMERYQRMLSQAKQWKPPTPDHVGLKRFMIEQLETSIDHDCSVEAWPKVPPATSGEEWRSKKIEKALHVLAYYEAENLKEIRRTEEINRWIDQLYESIGREAPKGEEN